MSTHALGVQSIEGQRRLGSVRESDQRSPIALLDELHRHCRKLAAFHPLESSQDVLIDGNTQPQLSAADLPAIWDRFRSWNLL